MLNRFQTCLNPETTVRWALLVVDGFENVEA